MEEIKIYTDGGARGNPGPSAGAFVVVSGGKVVYKKGEFFGIGTNNAAEYKALVLSIKWLLENEKELNLSMATFFLDSELVVKQLRGEYRVKSAGLKPVVDALRKDLEKLNIQTKFISIPREKNKIADALVNKTLDESPKENV